MGGGEFKVLCYCDLFFGCNVLFVYELEVIFVFVGKKCVKGGIWFVIVFDKVGFGIFFLGIDIKGEERVKEYKREWGGEVVLLIF